MRNGGESLQPVPLPTLLFGSEELPLARDKYVSNAKFLVAHPCLECSAVRVYDTLVFIKDTSISIGPLHK